MYPFHRIVLKRVPVSHSIEAWTTDPELSDNWPNTEATTMVAVAAEVEELVGRCESEVTIIDG